VAAELGGGARIQLQHPLQGGGRVQKGGRDDGRKYRRWYCSGRCWQRS
jgi:hypothetical protein